ncbi:Glycoside hydrolase family 17, partial [Dillenia turbinata]
AVESISNRIGVNYGRLGNNLLSPYQSIELIKSTKAGRVKLYDANPEILKLLAGTKIRVAIMVSNQQINEIASSQDFADKWVIENVHPYYPQTLIRYLLVGNEVLSYNTRRDREIWYNLVPAMQNIKNSLNKNYIRNIKIGTPFAMDVLETAFPPSNGTFRSDITKHVILPLLDFLNRTRSYFFIDVYPYFPWSENSRSISIDYALFEGNATYKDTGSGLVYTNLLDQMLDSIYSAMEKLGFPHIRIVISETGWPHEGDIDQHGANVYNAATYNRNLVKKMTAEPPSGTPSRPGAAIPTFIFSLYDENQKRGPGTERHWGLFHPEGTPVYEIDLTGKRDLGDYEKLPLPRNNDPYRGKIWCVAVRDANVTLLEQALSYACSQGKGTCDALAPGKACYEPVWLPWHASYAFSSYWSRQRNHGATCYFGGLAIQTTRDPSRGSCKVPSVTV